MPLFQKKSGVPRRDIARLPTIARALFQKKSGVPRQMTDAEIKELLKPVKDSRCNGLYDRVLLKAGVPTPHEIVCFQRGVDQEELWAKGSAWLETNMLHGCCLPAPFDAIICRFLFLFQPTCAVSDVAAFLRNYVWEFWLLHKVIQREPMLRCAASGNMAELIEGFGEPEGNGKVRPFARPYSFHLGNRSIYVPPLTEFRLKMIGRITRALSVCAAAMVLPTTDSGVG